MMSTSPESTSIPAPQPVVSAQPRSSTPPVQRPVGRLAEIQAKNKKKILAQTGATNRLRGHAKATVKRSQAKRDSRNAS